MVFGTCSSLLRPPTSFDVQDTFSVHKEEVLTENLKTKSAFFLKSL